MNPEEREIEQAMEQMQSETPIELKARLRMLASSAKVGRPSPWPARLAFAGAGATLVAILAISLSPSPADAKSFDKVVDATEQARTFSFEAIRYQGGKPARMSVGYSEGKFVMRSGDAAVMVMDSTTMKMYNARTNVVTVMPLSGSGAATSFYETFREGMKQMDLKKMLENWRRQYGAANITVGPIVQRDGRRVYDVALLRPREERVRLTVEAATDLPVHIESEKAQGAAWTPGMMMDIRFGDRADRTLTDFTVPANAKVAAFDFSMMAEAMATMKAGAAGKPGASSSKLHDLIKRMIDSMGKDSGAPSGPSRP